MSLEKGGGIKGVAQEVKTDTVGLIYRQRLRRFNGY